MISAVMPTYARADLAFERGEGSWLVSVDGRRFLDFASGVAVTSLGHNHPKLVAALIEQAGKVWHTSNLFRVPGQEKLAAKLIANSFADTVFFCNSGAEALEGTIKVVRKHFAAKGQPNRNRIITFEGAFHGRTLATLAAAGNKKYLEGFGPDLPGFDNIAFGDLDLVKRTIGPDTAGILVEPVQGEGGIRVVSDEFMKGLRALCDQHGLLLALDEVQSGMGRTGKLFGYEWSGVKPDVMALAKALGGGFPVGAVLATADAAAGMMAGTHGSTFGGNPLAMAVANAAFDVIAEPAFLDSVNQRANYMRQQLAMIVDNYGDIIEEVRGKGLHLGLKCRVPNTEFGAALREQELLSVGAGDNVVRVMPPLNVSEAEIAEGVRRIEAACLAMRAANKKKQA